MLVSQVMTSRVVTVEPGTPIGQAASTLTRHGFTAVPVADGMGDLVGVVTEADLLCRRVHHDPRSAKLADELTQVPPRIVAEVMTTEVQTVPPWADAADVVERMRADGLRSLPVVRPGGALVGIVTRRDLLGATVHADDTIARDVRRRLETYAGRVNRPSSWSRMWQRWDLFVLATTW